jgi:hypothetical protein
MIAAAALFAQPSIMQNHVKRPRDREQTVKVQFVYDDHQTAFWTHNSAAIIKLSHSPHLGVPKTA